MPSTKQIEVIKDYMGRGVVRRLNNSKSYFMRFRFYDHKGWTPWRTTGTSDVQKATRIASERYDKLKEELRDSLIKTDVAKLYTSSRFMGLVEHWLKEYELRAREASNRESIDQYAFYRSTADRYLAEFFRTMPISEITTDVIYDYIEWRRNYWVSGPGSKVVYVEVERNGKTYRKPVNHKPTNPRSGEIGFLKSVFDMAVRRGKISEKQVPEFPSFSKSIKDIQKTRHPAFSKEHWAKLLAALPSFIDVPNPNHILARKLFCHYVVIMAETGLRPGKEYQQLSWQNVTFNKDDETGQEYAEVYVDADNKTGARVVICGPVGCAELKKLKAWTRFSQPTDPVFANQQTGAVVKRFDKLFKQLLDYAGISQSNDGKDYAPYSLRHTYATRKREQGFDDTLLLRMMGHSDHEMIFKHYGQDLPDAHLEKIIAADTGKRRSDHQAIVRSVLEIEAADESDLQLVAGKDGVVRPL